jgi:hypothetical protein
MKVRTWACPCSHAACSEPEQVAEHMLHVFVGHAVAWQVLHSLQSLRIHLWAPLPMLHHVPWAPGGVFKLELFLPEDYPMAPPKVWQWVECIHFCLGSAQHGIPLGQPTRDCLERG